MFLLCEWFSLMSGIDSFIILLSMLVRMCRATLLDIDGCMDYVTLIEDEKIISADEAICGRQAVLRGDPQLTAILQDRNLQGYKWKIAAAIRQLHDSLVSSNPRAQSGGGLSLSSRPPRNRLSGFFRSMGGDGSDERAAGSKEKV